MGKNDTGNERRKEQERGRTTGRCVTVHGLGLISVGRAEEIRKTEEKKDGALNCLHLMRSGPGVCTRLGTCAT